LLCGSLFRAFAGLPCTSYGSHSSSLTNPLAVSSTYPDPVVLKGSLKAADRLLLHRNSMNYRLERVGELTWLDYSDHRARLAMQLGLLAIGEERSAKDADEHP